MRKTLSFPESESEIVLSGDSERQLTPALAAKRKPPTLPSPRKAVGRVKQAIPSPSLADGGPGGGKCPARTR